MKTVKATIILVLILVFSIQSSIARNAKGERFLEFQHRGLLAVNFGGTLPIPIPNSFSPTGFGVKFCPTVGYEMVMMSDYGFGLLMGLRYEAKGMRADADVYQIYTNATVDDATASGYFTGKNHTEIYNQYLVLPVGIAWQPRNERWQVNANFYIAQAVGRSFKGYVSDGYLRQDTPTGPKIAIGAPQAFDFKNEVSTFDYGVEVGFYRTIYKKFQFNTHLSWGLKSIMNKDFTGLPYKMHNVYARIGFSYRFL